MLSTEYLPKPICSSPVLPNNTGLALPLEIESAVRLYNDPESENEVKIENIDIIEEYLLKVGTCDKLNPDIVEDMKLRLFTFNDEILDFMLSHKETLNHILHDNIACIVSAIIYNDKTRNKFSITQRERIKNSFTNIQQLGSEADEGYVFTTSFSFDSNLFVVKSLQYESENLNHEAVIGLYCTNKLRKFVPNFMYVYGTISCSPIIKDAKDNIISWCTTTQKSVVYLITERIKDSVSFSDFIIKSYVTAEDVIKIFFQIENALNIAYKFYKYTHYDLHSGNILIRTFLEPVAIPYYSTDNKIVGHIITKYVPYIIDYGFNTAKVGSISLGKVGFEDFEIDNQNPYPMYDVYKLLITLGISIFGNFIHSKHTESIQKTLTKLFSFFEEDLEKAQKQAKLDNDNIIRKDYRNTSHDDYITWMEMHYDLTLKSGQENSTINTTCDLYNSIGTNPSPRTSFEYCETLNTINKLPKEDRDKVKEWLDKNFSAEDYFNSNDQETVSRAFSSNIAELPLITSRDQLISPIFIKDYKSIILDTLYTKEMLDILKSFIKFSTCSLSSQGVYDKYITEINTMKGIVDTLTAYIENQKHIGEENKKFIDSMKRKSGLDYYWTVYYPKLVELL